MSELARRCYPATVALRRHQPPTVAQVAGTVHVAFIADLILLMGWPDWRLPWSFLEGFRVVGRMPETGVFHSLPVPEGCEHSVEEVLAQGASVRASLHSLPRQEHEEFIWQSCEE